MATLRVALFLACLLAWPFGATAAERGTRVFVVEYGRFTAEALSKVFEAYEAREHTLYYGTAYGSQVNGPAADAAENARRGAGGFGGSPAHDLTGLEPDPGVGFRPRGGILPRTG